MGNVDSVTVGRRAGHPSPVCSVEATAPRDSMIRFIVSSALVWTASLGLWALDAHSAVTPDPPVTSVTFYLNAYGPGGGTVTRGPFPIAAWPAFTPSGVMRTQNTVIRTGIAYYISPDRSQAWVMLDPRTDMRSVGKGVFTIVFRAVFKVDNGGCNIPPVPFSYTVRPFLPLPNSWMRFDGDILFERLPPDLFPGMVTQYLQQNTPFPLPTPFQPFPRLDSGWLLGPTTVPVTLSGQWLGQMGVLPEPPRIRTLIISSATTDHLTWRWDSGLPFRGGDGCGVGFSMTDVFAPPDPAEPDGACALPDALCLEVPQVVCDEGGGLWSGAGTTCGCLPLPADCGNNVLEPGEECDGTSDEACPGGCNNCRCAEPPPPRCGNGILEGVEHCDGDLICPGDCGADCTCPFLYPIPTVSAWGLVALTLLLLCGGKVLGRSRAAAR